MIIKIDIDGLTVAQVVVPDVAVAAANTPSNVSTGNRLSASFAESRAFSPRGVTGGNPSVVTGGNPSIVTGGNPSVVTGGNPSIVTGGNPSVVTGGNPS